jgi:hypothetical protein
VKTKVLEIVMKIRAQATHLNGLGVEEILVVVDSLCR